MHQGTGGKGSWGGSRTGAGRRPKAHRYQQHIKKADRYIAPRLKALIEQIETIGRGLEVVREVRGPDGTVIEKRIRSGRPNLPALVYLVNRLMGRPAAQPEEPDTLPPISKYDFSRLSADQLEELGALLTLALAPAADPAAKTG